MHLCRNLFSTILEEDGKLFGLLSSHFAYSKYLYDDIVNNMLEDNFKNYIYSLYQDNDDIDRFVDDRNPYELLDCAGYTLYECKNEEEIQEFRKYYESKENLCTFRGNRLNRCYVFFAVKKNVEEINRENFINPYRQDLYGTSVISIQFSRGDINTVSIKNRYNHMVDNPDATFSNNLDNIIPGLTYSFEKYYNLNIGKSSGIDFEIPGYVKSRDIIVDNEVIPGKYYKYNYEINNIYYCDNNIIIDNFTVVDKYSEKEKYILMDYFIVDLVNKKIFLYDKNIEDSFVDTVDNINKIDISRNKNNGNRMLRIIFDNGRDIFIEIDKYNRIIGYYNDNISYVHDNFLKENIYLENIKLDSVLRIGDNVLYKNLKMNDISISKVLEIGDKFLYKNNTVKNISFPCVLRVGNDFLSKNKVIESLSMLNLIQVGDSYLYDNRMLKEIYLPKLEYVGDNFICCNRIIQNVNLDSLVSCGNNFLSSNKDLVKLELFNLIQVGGNFLRCNVILEDFYAEKLEIIGSNFMYSNRNLNSVILSRLRVVDNNFLYKNNSIKMLELNELCKVGPCFMKENNSLIIFYASKLMSVGINFLPNNRVLEYVDFCSLQEYNRAFLESNDVVKNKVLCLK